ncbi:MAG: hypothetical protein AAFY28_02325 [Actinomycetota bacterium]
MRAQRNHGILNGTMTLEHDDSLPVDAGDDTALPDTTTADSGVSPPRRRRRIDVGLMIASGVIAAGLLLIVFGFLRAVTGDEGIDRPDAIESLSPVEDSVQVLRQEGVVVDFEFGYEAVLIIDGIELPTEILGQIEAEPGQQLALPPTAVFDAGNAIISFQPVDGAPIEEFTAGLHEATVIYWKTEDGPDTARSYSWSFNVI